MSETKTLCFLLPQKTSANGVCRVLIGRKRVKLTEEGKQAILNAGRARGVVWWHPGGSAFRNMDFAIRFDRIRPVLEESYGVRFATAPTFANRQVDEDGVPAYLAFKQDFIEVTLEVPAAQYDALTKYWL